MGLGQRPVNENGGLPLGVVQITPVERREADVRLPWHRAGLPIDLPPLAEVRRVGVEHEYAVWLAGQRLDFRTLLPVVAGGLPCLDPGDPRARRLPSGVSLTADGQEAELATPPLPWGPGAPALVDRLLAAERSELAHTLAESRCGDRLTGFSTHVNVSVADAEVVEAGRKLAHRLGLALAVVGEPATSSGLLVRPRRGRLEVGGEYAEGEHLLALVTFVGSAVSALADPAAFGPPPEGLPEPVVVPSREKFGWYLPPEGPYARRSRDQLVAAWAWARPACERDGVDPAPVDRLVAGAPLRLESAADPGTCTVAAGPGRAAPATTITDTGPRDLAGAHAETVWLTWQHAVWRFASGGRTLYAVVPAAQEAEFLTRLDAGHFDEEIRHGLASPAVRRLMVSAQLTGASWWHEVRPGALVPAERGPDGAVPRVSYRRAARQHAHDSANP